MAVLRQRRGDVAPDLLRALEEFQSWFADQKQGPYFFGKQFSIVDLAIAPL